MLIFAGARDTSLAALALDSPAADILPVVEREVEKSSGVPAFLVPGGLLATQALYGINWYDIRTTDVVAKLAPRPLFLIQGARDDFIPLSNHSDLMAVLNRTPQANVQEWLVPGAKHAQSFHTAGREYVDRVVAFFNAGLGADSNAG
jgi:fermentation-respiration switch protein FrsA (DUF1100 family)